MSLNCRTLLFVCLCSVGCSAAHQSMSQRSENQIERGQPRPVLDGAGWVIGIPQKIVLWNSRVDNHKISEETEERIAAYLAANHESDVKVRLNQYAPMDEWRRLHENKRMGAGWRYTLGTFATLGYTVLPGRVFGGDWYNPYTNTVHVYSDVPSIAMSEAAYAVDVHWRKYPGTYAASQELPGLNLWHETLATRNVIDYLSRKDSPEQVAEAYNVLYPRYGLSAGSGVGSYFSGASFVFEGTGVLIGHGLGRHRSHELLANVAETPTAIRANGSDDNSGDLAVRSENSPVIQCSHPK